MDTFIGMTAATMGRWDEAQRRFDSVLRLSRANLPRIFPVQIRLTYARMFLARNEAGDRERAKEQLTKVISIAEEVGAGGWADLARSTLATAGA